jgi:hypothetical protein
VAGSAQATSDPRSSAPGDGCAGFGYGGDQVTPRVAQYLSRGSWRYLHAEKPQAQRYVRITPHRYRARGVIHAPFVIACAVIEGLQSDPDWILDDGSLPLPERAWRCPWCNGTGKRDLTLHTMEIATKP